MRHPSPFCGIVMVHFDEMRGEARFRRAPLMPGRGRRLISARNLDLLKFAMGLADFG
jgi:hypothetical protein